MEIEDLDLSEPFDRAVHRALFAFDESEQALADLIGQIEALVLDSPDRPQNRAELEWVRRAADLARRSNENRAEVVALWDSWPRRER